MPGTDIQQTVQKKYGEIASAVKTRSSRSCCGPSCCSGDAKDPISSDLYSSDQASTLPQPALDASLGCGNPTALIDLREGETVLDLGSGGGVDVLLSARRVGPSGKVYGPDMTEEMLDLARTISGEPASRTLSSQRRHQHIPCQTPLSIHHFKLRHTSPHKGAVLRELPRAQAAAAWRIHIVALGEVGNRAQGRRSLVAAWPAH